MRYHPGLPRHARVTEHDRASGVLPVEGRQHQLLAAQGEQQHHQQVQRVGEHVQVLCLQAAVQWVAPLAQSGEAACNHKATEGAGHEPW